MAPSRPGALAIVTLLAGCAPGPPHEAARAAITNGVIDPGDPAVVAIVDDTGTVGCTGSLVGPHSVLTAAHCLVDPLHFDTFHVIFGASATTPDGTLDLSDARAHPGFDPATLANDVALLTLRQLGPAPPLAMRTTPLDGTLVGQLLDVVGFGTTGATSADPGQKHSGTAKISAVAAGDFTGAPSPSQPCVGDSGGPALIGGAVAGITSHGDTGCADHTVFARVDVAQDAFIQPALAALADGSANVGERCYFDEQCSAGPCLVAADDPKRSFCSQPCSGGGCPTGMTCAPDGCRYAGPSPGALGSSCMLAGDCADGNCFMGKCTRTCVASGSDCPSGFTCTNTGQITFYCLKTPRSGCEFATGGGAPPLLGGLLVLLLIGGWRCAPRRRSR